VERNFLYLVAGALAVVAAMLGYRLYEEHQNRTAIGISISDHAVSIERH